MNRILVTLCCLVLAWPALAAETSAKDATATQTPAARIIVLVRHGNYVSDPAADEQLGPHQSPLGGAQAHLAGGRLAGRPASTGGKRANGKRFDGLYVSPMLRARDTAAAISHDFPGRIFEVVDDLAECTPPTRRTEITKDDAPKDLANCKARLIASFRGSSGQRRTVSRPTCWFATTT